MSTYKLTKKAETDLLALVEFSVQRFGPANALRFVDEMENRIQALARREFEGSEVTIGARARPVRR